jgi:glutamate 5-kinase
MPSMKLRQEVLKAARRVVVKFGTALLTKTGGVLDTARISSLVRQVAELHRRGCEVTIVSSGAIGAGMGLVGIKSRPRDVAKLQALAATGQAALMQAYERAFARYGLHAAQILLTRSDVDNRLRYLNIRNTLANLQELNAVPIINENDPVAVEEIRFGENDVLSALVANLVEADALVILTVVDGLLAQGQLVEMVDAVDENVLSLVNGGKSTLGSGGFLTKLEAMRMVTDAGAVAAIVNGRTRSVILRLMNGERLGTIFVPAAERMPARDRWIRMVARPTGKVQIDAGAAKALVAGHKSLLPIGVVQVTGRFERGDVVQIVTAEGRELGRGLVNYSASELSQIKGLRSSKIAQALGAAPYEEAVHCDNLVLMKDHGRKSKGPGRAGKGE